MDIYLDCTSGISGDMFLGALFDLGLDFQLFKKEIKKLDIAGYRLAMSKEKRNGIVGTRFIVSANQRCMAHRTLADITAIIKDSQLKESIKQKSCAMFKRLARVEASVHKQPVSKIHFHEVGALDSIIDIVGSVIAIDLLGIDTIYVSDVVLGSGKIKTQHGVIPIPAPATVALLKGYNFPLSLSAIKEELVTPTGALLLTEFGSEIKEPFSFSIEEVGYGVGARKIKEIPNLLCMMRIKQKQAIDRGHVVTLETNIDDMSPQLYDYLFERLFKAGALDVWLVPLHMKKNRPGMLLAVLASAKLVDTLSAIIFEETTSLGIRIHTVSRVTLKRTIRSIKTSYGIVRIKVAAYGAHPNTVSPEYEDCKKLAIKHKTPLRVIYNEALKVALAQN